MQIACGWWSIALASTQLSSHHTWNGTKEEAT
jgi:hypothetical protein